MTDAGAKKSRLLSAGALILSNSGSVCLPKILRIDGCIHDGFVAFPNLEDWLDTDYAFYMFDWMRPSVIEKHRQGMTQVNLNTEIVRNFRIPLPPRAEQKRIANKLDTVIAKVNACLDALDRVPQILKTFREAVLEAAVSGRLTEEWRASGKALGATGDSVVNADAAAKRATLAKYPELAKKKSTFESSLDEEYVFDIPNMWSFTTWGTVSEWVTYGFTRPMPHAEHGVPLITAKDVQYFRVLIDQAQYTNSKAFGELSDKDRPKNGDLLLTKDGTIGRAALVQTDKPFCINQSVAVVWLRSTSMNKRYLELVANAGFTQHFIRDKAKGMAIQHLSITDFAQCPLPVPPGNEQSEIVRRVDGLFALADSLQRRYRDAVSDAERLTPSVLAKAFRGELVSQDPNDKPAGEMLARIRQTQGSENVTAGPRSKTVSGRSTHRVETKGGRRLRASSA